MICRHCGGDVVDSGDGFHYIHVASNSKYCEPNGPSDNAVRGRSDLLTLQHFTPDWFYTSPGDEQLVFLATAGTDGPVGVLHLSIDPDVAFVEHIFVLPEYRRRGIGRRMIHAAQDVVDKRIVHDNHLSLLGSKFTKAMHIRKLDYPYRRIGRAEADGSGLRLLHAAALHAKGQHT